MSEFLVIPRLLPSRLGVSRGHQRLKDLGLGLFAVEYGTSL